ncbi:sugar phosphate isomerase/epimerase family protein [Chelativorans intermedius]|uniref:Sugar phosphate isomerase/epimerase family protein n=1 Tax=Chelativorans intermedius TaxID=515947 RepID=A0ABV6D7I8_9HYPH|nr:sugar phosphate isomerase/epimerase [Chelativorans intermedius]MCT8999773.1 sugar phosphate isomerase/epimerase [Chelativorans intermedius]
MTEFSYQLYSSREFPPLAQTLKMLRSLGYAQVEGYGGVYGDLPALKAALDEAGIAMTSGHFSLDMLENEPDRVLEIAQTVGMQAAYCPHLAADQRPADGAGYARFGERLQKAGEPLVKAGLIFGWHNHDFEFRPLADGAVPQAEIFRGGPELSWEADIAWIVRGGADPLEWIEAHGARISSVHIKDIAPEGEKADEDGWADVGTGIMDWRGLMAAVREKTKARFFVMEHDKPSDHERFARRSIENAGRF